MSILILLEFTAKPANAGDLTSYMKDELHYTRGSDGCNSVTVHKNQDDPNNMVIVEDWDSRQQYDKYLAWRRDRGDLEKMMGWTVGEASIRYFDNSGV